MGQLGNDCRARAAECTLAARAAGWRGDNALKALYLALAQQWLEIAIIGDAADQERVSTPQQRCIGWPEQKYIIDAGKKAAGPGCLSSDIRLGWDYPPVCPSWHGLSGAYSD